MERVNALATTVCTFTIIAVCLPISPVLFAFGWQQRTHSRANVIFSVLFGAFLLYAALVLVLQTIEDWKYKNVKVKIMRHRRESNAAEQCPASA